MHLAFVGTLLCAAFLSACQVRFLPQDAGNLEREPDGVVEPAVGPEGQLEPDPAPSQPEPNPPEPSVEPDGEPGVEPDGGPLPEPDGEPAPQPEDGGPGPEDGGVIEPDAGPGDLDGGVFDAGPGDAGSVDPFPFDAGPLDAGAFDAGPIDAGPPPAVCGNFNEEPGEACDDGNLDDRDGCSSECQDWWDPGWPFRASVVIDRPNTLTDVLTDVPVLVRLPSALVQDMSLTPEGHCFIADDDVTVLPSQIERIGNIAQNEDALFWVRVPSLPVGITTIQIYTGGTNGCPKGDDGDVFAPSYSGVWHFNDTNWGDATGRGRDLSRTDPSVVPTDGIVGSAVRTSTGERLVRTSVDTEFVHVGNLTLEAWVRVRAANGIANSDSFENTLFHVASGGGGGRVPVFMNLEDSGRLRNYWGLTSGGHSTSVQTTSLGSPIAFNEWIHVVAVRDATAGRERFYENGIEIHDSTYVIQPRGDDTGFNLYIGGNRYSVNRDVIGSMDEARISTQAHSPAWIRFQYDQMADPSVVTIGTPEPKPVQ